MSHTEHTEQVMSLGTHRAGDITHGTHRAGDITHKTHRAGHVTHRTYGAGDVTHRPPQSRVCQLHKGPDSACFRLCEPRGKAKGGAGTKGHSICKHPSERVGLWKWVVIPMGPWATAAKHCCQGVRRTTSVDTPTWPGLWMALCT